MANEKITGCEFCLQKPYIGSGGWFVEDENQIMIAKGNWCWMFIGVDKDGEIVMRACGDDYTKDYHPKYCPECGRRLRSTGGANG